MTSVSIAMVQLLLIHCLASLLLYSYVGFVFSTYFVMQFLVSALILQSFRWGRENLLLDFNCIHAVM